MDGDPEGYAHLLGGDAGEDRGGHDVSAPDHALLAFTKADGLQDASVLGQLVHLDVPAADALQLGQTNADVRGDLNAEAQRSVDGDVRVHHGSGSNQGGQDDVRAAQLGAATLAVDHRIVSAIGRVGGLHAVLLHGLGRLVAQGIQSGMRAAQLRAAALAVDHGVEAAGLGAGRLRKVLLHGICLQVAQGRDHSHVGFACQQADIGDRAGLGAGGLHLDRRRGPDVAANVAGVAVDVVDDVRAVAQAQVGGLGRGIAAGEDHVGVAVAVQGDLVVAVAVLVLAQRGEELAGEGGILSAVTEGVGVGGGVGDHRRRGNFAARIVRERVRVARDGPQFTRTTARQQPVGLKRPEEQGDKRNDKQSGQAGDQDDMPEALHALIKQHIVIIA